MGVVGCWNRGVEVTKWLAQSRSMTLSGRHVVLCGRRWDSKRAKMTRRDGIVLVSPVREWPTLALDELVGAIGFIWHSFVFRRSNFERQPRAKTVLI